MTHRLKIIFLLALTIFLGNALWAQQEVNGEWVDDELEWVIVNEAVRQDGTLRLCIANSNDHRCIENLFTAFEIRVYDAQGEEIWNGLWMGEKKAIRFRKALPTAHRMEIKATKPFVINWVTGTKIHQTKPLVATYFFP